MSSINFNRTGETNVKSDETILYRPNVIDVMEAGIEPADKADWDDFQIMGDAKNKEENYKNIAPRSDEDLEKVLERAKHTKIGHKILSLQNLKLGNLSKAA